MLGCVVNILVTDIYIRFGTRYKDKENEIDFARRTLSNYRYLGLGHFLRVPLERQLKFCDAKNVIVKYLEGSWVLLGLHILRSVFYS